FGSFMDARGYFSVTDWSDAAIRFYAYNPGVTDLTVYFMWTADGTAWHGADHDSSPAGIVLKGGEWTTVTWSLNDLGITTDFLANTEAKFWLKIGNAGPWEFYMCGMDIIDYDSAANGIANALLKSWSDDDVSRTLTADPQYLYDGCGVGVSVGYTGNDGLRNFGSFRDARTYFSVTDWGDAAIRFYAYNPGETDLTVHLGWTADGNEWHGADYSGLPAGIYLKGGEWTTVTWSLNDLEITTDFLANTNANFMLKIGNAGPWEFYMCGMDIINAE
ncbi:MAG: hypothetical protein LBL66_10315, partial [Clostridiales bacterium]|nr:hypothetical protein [Clostridiales bacterium]